MDILVKLIDTKLEIGPSISINSYSRKVRICFLHACSASVEHNSFFLLSSFPSLILPFVVSNFKLLYISKVRGGGVVRKWEVSRRPVVQGLTAKSIFLLELSMC